MGTGAYAGGGTSLSIYPRATSDQVMGSGVNVGGTLGLPGVSVGLDLNVSLQQDQLTQKVNDVKLGVSGGVKLGSLGPGGAEVHVDYSKATPFFEFNLFAMPRSEIIAKIEAEVDDSWFLSLSKDQINNLVDYMYSTQGSLKKMFDDNNPKKSASTPQQEQPKQKSTSQPTQQKPVKQKTKQREQAKPKPPQQQSTTPPADTNKQTKPLKAF